MRWLFALMLASPVWGGEIGPEGMDHLPLADVYVFGETHDNADHHLNQARGIASSKPRAVVWEMLDEAAAGRVIPGSAMADLDAQIGWTGSGWPEFSMYYPIFVAAGTAQHYGADVARDGLMRAMVGEIVIAGYGLDRALSPEDQAAREAEQAAAHCGMMPEDKLAGMVAVQRLRDAAIAKAVVQAMADTGGPVVVITGSGHARTDTGVPAVLRAVAPGLRVLSVGQIGGDPGGQAPFDLWIASEIPDGPDPCDAFR